MPWIIDKDLLADKSKPMGTVDNAVGVSGPGGYKGNGKELTHKFRLLDDDGEVYYEGRSHDDSSFAPLDNFGMPNAGCTEIQYRTAKGWETL